MVDSFSQAENKQNDSDEFYLLMRQLQAAEAFLVRQLLFRTNTRH